MIVSPFCILDKNDKKRFFKESFLLADMNSDIIFEISFKTMGNANINFQA